MCLCARARVCVCERARVRVCVLVRMCVLVACVSVCLSVSPSHPTPSLNTPGFSALAGKAFPQSPFLYQSASPGTDGLSQSGRADTAEPCLVLLKGSGQNLCPTLNSGRLRVSLRHGHLLLGLQLLS